MTRTLAGRLGVLLSAATAGCAALLGGLDEGTERRDAPDVASAPEAAGSETGPPPSPACPDALEGFPHHISFEVWNGEPSPLSGYPVALGFDARDAVLEGRMRSDGADLRVTRAGAPGTFPYERTSAVGAATRIWAKLDLAVGRNVVHVHYGSPSATAEETTAFEDVLADGALEGDAGPWKWIPQVEVDFAAEIDGGRATLRAAPEVDGPDLVTAAWCRAVKLPAGPGFRIVFDVSVVQGEMAVWAAQGGTDSPPVWSSDAPFGLQREVETLRFGGVSASICVGGRVRPPHVAVEGWIANLRLRPAAATDPIASPASGEVTCVSPDGGR